MSSTEGIWLSISDYSQYKNVSVSTIRRHIKNNIIKHREDNGKYFIYVSSTERVKLREDEEILKLKLEIELMKVRLRDMQEENNELKMLVNLYEGRVESVPEVPSFHE